MLSEGPGTQLLAGYCSLSAPRGHSVPCYVVLSTGLLTTQELASSKPKREKVSTANLGAQKNFT